MDLHFTPDEEAFRAEVRAWLRGALPESLRESVAQGEHVTREQIEGWQRLLHARGWGASSWPAQWGGPGWDPIRQHIFEEECALAGAPRQLPFGLRMVGPVLMKFGTPAQQQRFLPRIPSAEDWWCQGYSEPGAGSDLANLNTRAVSKGDRYVVSGQKTWTTLAQHANWMFALVRTDAQARKQEGISFLLIDMTSPGVTVRPIVLLDGAAEVNDVFLDEVEVPVAQRVGEENQGWTIAKYLLEHERSNIANVGISKRELARAWRLARQVRRHGRPLIDDSLFTARLAEVEAELMALEIMQLRVLTAARDGAGPGPLSSMLKIKGSEILQRISELILEAQGINALRCDLDTEPPGRWVQMPEAAQYLNLRKVSIYGGSNEIQRGILAKHVLGL
ncbi:MAG: acyl-CoA dehydrogenase family protein [Burkholderiaceae bacterium]|jgi:alkylation response protein AidB-like acyl-CoA dehydrogenase|nr:acyl-CoA dehydrogenase family protein [Burkholderiaceae bacterium]